MTLTSETKWVRRDQFGMLEGRGAKVSLCSAQKNEEKTQATAKYNCQCRKEHAQITPSTTEFNYSKTTEANCEKPEYRVPEAVLTCELNYQRVHRSAKKVCRDEEPK